MSKFFVSLQKKSITKHKAYLYGVTVLRAMLIYTIFAILMFFIDWVVRNFLGLMSTDPFGIFIRILFSIASLNTVILNFYLFNRTERETFLAQKKRVIDKKVEHKSILTSPFLWTEIGTLCVCLLLFPKAFGYNAFLNLIFFIPRASKIPFILQKLILLAIFFTSTILLELHTRMDSRRAWLEPPEPLVQKHVWESMEKRKKNAYSYRKMANAPKQRILHKPDTYGDDTEKISDKYRYDQCTHHI